MMPLSMFALAIAGWTTSPPSIASQALWTRILPLARSSDISAPPAPRAQARRNRHALEAEFDRVHALGHRHLVDERFDGEHVEDMADRAPLLEPDAVRNSARLDALVGDLVIRNADAGGQEPAAVADNAERTAGA